MARAEAPRQEQAGLWDLLWQLIGMSWVGKRQSGGGRCRERGDSGPMRDSEQK